MLAKLCQIRSLLHKKFHYRLNQPSYSFSAATQTIIGVAVVKEHL